MPDDWTEVLPVTYVLACATWGERLPKLFTDFDAKGRNKKERITTYHILSELELKMPRKGKSNGSITGNGNNSGSGASGGVKWQWANIKLTDDDADILEQSDATLEYVATCLAALADDSMGVTIKPVDEGKSRCVTIYRSDFPSRGTTVGVSSFGSTVRDAGLACLYKLDTYLGGDFSAYDQQDDNTIGRPRFR